MFTIDDIEKIFDYSTESKISDEDKKEKNNRRIETICMKVPEVRHAIYDSRKGVLESLQIVNDRYASLLEDKSIENAINELRTFLKLISNSHIDMHSKAIIIKSFDFKDYKKLLCTCKLTGLKTISRLTNMKTMAIKFIEGRFGRKEFSDDLKEQITFLENLLQHYETISVHNFYAYILRYDLKTIKKRNPNIKNRR